MEVNELIEKGLAEVKAKVTEATEKSTNEVQEIKGEIKTVSVQVTEVKEYAEKLQNHVDSLEMKLKGSAVQNAEKKSFNDVLADAINENEDNYQKFLRKEKKSFAIELKAVGDMSTANVTGGSRYGQIFDPNIRLNPNRKVNMSQVLRRGSIGAGNTYTFMRENGNGEGAIAPAAEGAMKSQFDLDLVEATVNVETIAGWLRVTRKAMNNIPGFVSFLQARLPEKFQRALDAQILYGNGTTPNLKGRTEQ